MKKNVIIYAAIIGFLLIGLAAAAVVAILAIRGATNPAAEKNETNPTVISFPTESSLFAPPVSTNPGADNHEITSTPTEEKPAESTTTSETEIPEATSTAEILVGQCGMEGQLVLLVIGQDEGMGLPPYGADAIRMMKIDFDQKKASIFAFQRDLLLNTPNLETVYGIPSSHLGDVYDIVMKREGTNPNAKTLASSAVAQVIYDNFNLVPDYYINLNETAIENGVNEIGGIEVNVPAEFSTTNYHFLPGDQHLDGQATWEYISDPGQVRNEWERFSRQDNIFAALRNKLLDPSIFPNVLNIYQDVSPWISTDLSTEQISSLICTLQEIPIEQIALTTFPETMITSYSDHSLALRDPAAAQQLVQSTFSW
jgi:anionic cell wall polymer biosynthesis LytR-Cps2A-Psr (LCP) family protein